MPTMSRGEDPKTHIRCIARPNAGSRTTAQIRRGAGLRMGQHCGHLIGGPRLYILCEKKVADQCTSSSSPVLAM